MSTAKRHCLVVINSLPLSEKMVFFFFFNPQTVPAGGCQLEAGLVTPAWEVGRRERLKVFEQAGNTFQISAVPYKEPSFPAFSAPHSPSIPLGGDPESPLRTLPDGDVRSPRSRARKRGQGHKATLKYGGCGMTECQRSEGASLVGAVSGSFVREITSPLCYRGGETQTQEVGGLASGRKSVRGEAWSQPSWVWLQRWFSFQYHRFEQLWEQREEV